MDNQDKARKYDQLMSEYHHLGNQISQVKSESFDLNETQLKQIRVLSEKQTYIMNVINGMMR
jgi:hypothetical protein